MAPEGSPTEPVPVTPRSTERALRLRWPWLSLLMVPLLLGAGFSLERSRARGRVLPRIGAGGVSLGGLDRAAAERAVGELGGRLRQLPLTVRCGQERFTLVPTAVGFEIDSARTVRAALDAGRSANVVRDFAQWIARWVRRTEVAVAGHVDRKELERLATEWDSKLPVRPFAGAIRVRNGQVETEYARPGFVVERDTLEPRILAGLLLPRRQEVLLSLRRVEPELGRARVDEARQRAERLVSAPVELRSDTPPATLRFEAAELGRALASRVQGATIELFFDPSAIGPSLAALKHLEHEPQDARFVVNGLDEVSVVAAEAGLKLDPAAVSRALVGAANATTRSGELPWDRSALPQFTTEAAEALRITRLVSAFTTHHPCCQPRVENIHRIADLLDGRVVKPGETFSVNQVVGPRTKANGFVPAPTIEEGEMVDTLGGGISQFATTFFNAVFHGGYDILERQPHTYYFARYPMGHEATLSYPKPDLVFRNDTEAGVLIRCEYGKDFIRVKIFGDNGGRKVTAKVSGQFDLKRPPVQLLPNRRLSPTREKVHYPGTVGWSVMVSRLLTFPDGTHREEKRKVTYNPRPREVEVHPCRIPKDEPGYTGEECPVPKETEDDEDERDPDR